MRATTAQLDATDRRIVNGLQGGFPLSERPFAEAGEDLGIGEDELIDRLERLVGTGVLSRFGPMLNAEKLGGAVTLCAMEVPAARFDDVAAIVGSLRAVAHNYERDHAFNMWFVIAAERPEEIASVIEEIEHATGIAVVDLPKEREFFIGLRIEA